MHPLPTGGVRWQPLDATDAQACRRLTARLRPRRVVLVHGPSDVTWCEEHPERAAAAAGDARVLMISTDNVFDGSSPGDTEDTPVSPANVQRRQGRAHPAARQPGGGAPLPSWSAVADRPDRLPVHVG
jgi:dTDP-4-dehydrorhamnose reductase